MKRSLWVALLCMGLTLFALPAAWIRIDQEKDKIVINQEILSGDPAAAAGVTLRIASHWQGHLLWNTEYVIGSGKGAESDFSFSAGQVAWERRAHKSAKMVFLYGSGFGTVVGVGSSPVSPRSMPYPEIAQAVAERTEAGEVHVETVKIRDYYEYYPVEFLLEGESVEYKGDYGQAQAYLTELFRIPPGDDSMEVTVEKSPAGNGIEMAEDAAGKPVSIHGQWAQGSENPLIAGTSAFGEGGCYYAFCLESWETGRPACRGENCGIFYLPIQEADGRIRVDLTQMRKLCPLPEGTVPTAMLLEEEKGRLYLAVKEERDYSLLVYGLEGSVPVLEQRISLGRGGIWDSQGTGALEEDAQSPDGGTEAANVMPQLCAMTREQGGLLMTWHDNGFAFVTEEEGQCRLWCSGRFPDRKDADSSLSVGWDIGRRDNPFPEERECFFDGERLVLAALNGWKSVDVLLAVYDKDGEVYSGLYRHSGGESDLVYGNLAPQGRNPYDWLEEPYGNEAYVQGTGELVKPLELKGR